MPTWYLMSSSLKILGYMVNTPEEKKNAAGFLEGRGQHV